MKKEKEKKLRRGKENNIKESSDESEELDDSDYIIEYDKDIIHDKLMHRIHKLITKEPKTIQNSYKLIETIKFDRNKIVVIDNQEYNCKDNYIIIIGISDFGLDLIKTFEFPNLRKRYNILATIFETQDTASVIEYVNANRTFFAIWAYAALYIDHNQFEKFLYHTIINYNAQKEEVEEIMPLKLSDIEPMTYARFL